MLLQNDNLVGVQGTRDQRFGALRARRRLGETWKMVRATRRYIQHCIFFLSEEEFVAVPQNFDTNVMWNLGHLMFSHERGRQPRKLMILQGIITFSLRRNSSDMSAGYAPFITMVRFERRKIAPQDTPRR